MTCRTNTNRRAVRDGFTLVEMLVAIALSGILSLICIRLLASLMDFERTGAVQLQQEVGLSRLNGDLRNDLAGALRIGLRDDVLMIEQSGDRIVTYAAKEDQMLRTNAGPDTADSPDRERYVLTNSIAAFRRDGNLLQVVIHPRQQRRPQEKSGTRIVMEFALNQSTVSRPEIEIQEPPVDDPPAEPPS